MFPLCLYSRHGYGVSSSDGSSIPCHIYISLFFVHLPLFSFSQMASFFPEAFSVFVLKMTSFLPLQADPLRPRGGVFDSLSSLSHLSLNELHTVACQSLKKLYALKNKSSLLAPIVQLRNFNIYGTTKGSLQ